MTIIPVYFILKLSIPSDFDGVSFKCMVVSVTSSHFPDKPQEIYQTPSREKCIQAQKYLSASLFWVTKLHFQMIFSLNKVQRNAEMKLTNLSHNFVFYCQHTPPEFLDNAICVCGFNQPVFWLARFFRDSSWSITSDDSLPGNKS